MTWQENIIQAVREHERKKLEPRRITDEISAIWDGTDRSPVTLLLKGRASEGEDGPIVVRIPLACYDEGDDFNRHIKILGERLLEVLDERGF